MLKDKVYSFMNIFGLALGLSAFIYIASMTFYERSFDSFHSKADRTFRCVASVKLSETGENLPRSEYPLAAAIRNEMPEVEASTRLYLENEVFVQSQENKFIEKEVWYADADVFDVFDFKLIEGDPSQALTSPQTVLLTPASALKYFGKEDPIGKTIRMRGREEPYLVTGILETLPKNSHMQFDILASFAGHPESKRVDWGSFNSLYSYVVAKEGVDLEEFEEKYKANMRKHQAAVISKYLGVSLEKFESQGQYYRHWLQPLTEIRMNTDFPEEAETYGKPRLLMVLSITGILILLIACCNFVNLSTAKSTFRAKEIGIKKVVGSKRKNIIRQVYLETLIYCSLALLLSIALIAATLPWLNNLTGVELSPAFFWTPKVLLTILAITLLTTLLSGIYPAFVITKYNLADSMKGRSNSSKSSPWMRNALVTVQFVVFIGLIFSTIVISKQIKHMRDQHPGFASENVLVVKNIYSLGSHIQNYKEVLDAVPFIEAASYSSTLPSMNDFEGNSMRKKGAQLHSLMDIINVDANYADALKMELIQGRWFHDQSESENNKLVLTEAAAKALGVNNVNEDIIDDMGNPGIDFEVVGIVKDLHMRSLREMPKPIVFRHRNVTNYLLLKVSPGNANEAIKLAQEKWEERCADVPFKSFFLDKNFDALYKAEDQLSRTISLFSIIAIVIACLGLFGLVAYNATQRTKEIGIRKVNGAKTHEILVMLNKGMLKWIAISFVIACPLAWYAMDQWLQNFAYKTSLSWWIYIVSGAVAIGIALATVSWQSWRAAVKNPVEALRYE